MSCVTEFSLRSSAYDFFTEKRTGLAPSRLADALPSSLVELYLTDDSERITGEVEETLRSIIEDKDSELPKLKMIRLSIEERQSEELIPNNPSLLI